MTNSSHRWTKWPCRISGETRPDDFCVARDGVALGRVHPAPYITGTLPFAWSSWVHPAQNGGANSLREALEQCRSAIGQRPVPPHIMRRLNDYSRKGADK